MKPEVSLATTGGGTELTLVDWLVSGVDSAVSLQTVALGEPRVADITLVRFLSYKYKHQQKNSSRGGEMLPTYQCGS